MISSSVIADNYSERGAAHAAALDYLGNHLDRTGHNLDQIVADLCEPPVVAGPAEATAMGNIHVQARALGGLPLGCSVRDIAASSAALHHYTSRLEVANP